MAGLLELLSKSSSAPKAGGMSDPGAESMDGGGFESAAAQVMDCLKNNDNAGFAEALKACIQMADSDAPAGPI
jgi:hypothetical protein